MSLHSHNVAIGVLDIINDFIKKLASLTGIKVNVEKLVTFFGYPYWVKFLLLGLFVAKGLRYKTVYIFR